MSHGSLATGVIETYEQSTGANRPPLDFRGADVGLAPGVALMTENDLVERLAKHRTLGTAPREELEWIATRGHVQRLAIGEQLAHTGMAVEGMYAILSGRFSIFLDKGGAPRKLANGEGEAT